MDQWIAVAERFGLPFIMLLGMSWGGVQLFKWLANDLMKQIADNHSRIEGIIIKLIDNSKQERADNKLYFENIVSDNKLYFEKVVTMLDSTYTMMAKIWQKNGK